MLCQPVICLFPSLCLWHMQMGENTINLAKQAGRVGLQRRLWLNRYGMKTETANDNESETKRESVSLSLTVIESIHNARLLNTL